MGASYGEKKTSVWAWIGGGCAVLLALFAIAVVSVGYIGYRTVRNVKNTMENPAQRGVAAREILGCETLPEGYHAAFALRVPLHAMDLAIITDREQEGNKKVQLGDHALMYLDLFHWGKSSSDLDDYFSGKSKDSDALSRNGIQLDLGDEEILKRGTLEGPPKLEYTVQRGRVHFERTSRDGLLSIIRVNCADTSRTRIAIWIGPDPKPGEKLDEAALAGTTGDGKRIEEFMKQFKFCR